MIKKVLNIKTNNLKIILIQNNSIIKKTIKITMILDKVNNLTILKINKKKYKIKMIFLIVTILINFKI